MHHEHVTRRSFLQSTALIVTVGALVPSFAAENPAPAVTRPKRRKGIMWDTVGVTGSILEKFQAIKTAGFDGVEMASHLDRAEVLKARDTTGLPIPSVCNAQHWAKPLSSPDPKVREEGLEALRHSLQDAKAYGAGSVLLVPGVVNEKISYQECWDRATEQIRKAIPLAEELGVKIALENVWNNFLLSPLEAARFVDQFNTPHVAWHFDVGNVINYGWPEQWIRSLGSRIATVHLKEFSRKRADKEGKWKGFDVKFLEGDDNWPAVMQALRDVNYQGWCIAEQGGGDTAEGLKDLADRIDKIFAS